VLVPAQRCRRPGVWHQWPGRDAPELPGGRRPGLHHWRRALNYGPEEIFEAFYNLEVRKDIYVTTDFQEVNHPAYKRGPVSIVSLRVHLQY
jgi:hypothetical protein